MSQFSAVMTIPIGKLTETNNEVQLKGKYLEGQG